MCLSLPVVRLNNRSGGVQMQATEPRPGKHTLQQAASVVFAMISVLPLLVFAYSLYALNAINQLEYDIGLGLALGVALLGFYIFRVLMTRVSELVRTVSQVASHVPVTGLDKEMRSEEHTSELQSRLHLVCRLLLEKKKKNIAKKLVY